MPTDNILSYAPPPTSGKALRALAHYLLPRFAVLGIALFVIYSALIRGPSSGQVRLDSGDIRYCWYGIPLYYQSMPEPYRSKILSLKSPVAAKWVTFAENPSRIEHDLTHRLEYRAVAAWAGTDPNIASFALIDLAHDLERGPWVLTKSFKALNLFVVDISGNIFPNWRDDDDVKDLCAAHGYTAPPAPKP